MTNIFKCGGRQLDSHPTPSLDASGSFSRFNSPASGKNRDREVTFEKHLPKSFYVFSDLSLFVSITF
jgi:hypothetical protein